MPTRTQPNGIHKRRKTEPSPLGGVIEGAEALVAATAEMGEEAIVDVRKSLQRDLHAAREHLHDLETGLKDRATGVDDYVHENPWQAIGVAAAAGVIVGALAFRR